MNRKLLLSLSTTAALGFALAGRAAADDKKPAAPVGNCKAFGTGRCCDPAMTAHLTKEAVFGACGKSDAQFLGEKGEKDTCKYFFKVEGEKDADMYVQVYAPTVKGAAPDSPPDPFVSWKKGVGKVMIAEPKSMKGVKSDKIKAIAEQGSGNVGLYLPGNGYYVNVSSSGKICSKSSAKALAGSMR